MRKTKRFTPTVLARFVRELRGTGDHETYKPWHSVSRGDPSSNGRSHLLMWRGRLRELLSDGELTAQHFITMLPNVIDSREQFPLSLYSDDDPLTLVVDGNDSGGRYPGTIEIARSMGLKPPRLNGDGISVPWIMSTDFLLDIQNPDGTTSRLALAFKPSNWNKRRRTVDLLNIERMYWHHRGVRWFLLTPDLHNKSISKTLSRVACWALGDPAPTELIDLAVAIAINDPFQPVSRLMKRLTIETDSMENAQKALWQAIWFGKLPVDLRLTWRPHLPLVHLSTEDFWKQNPIASRSSAWI